MTPSAPARSRLPLAIAALATLVLLGAGLLVGMNTVTVPIAPYLSAPYSSDKVASCGSAWSPNVEGAVRALDTGPAGYQQTPREVCADARFGHLVASLLMIGLAVLAGIAAAVCSVLLAAPPRTSSRAE